MKNKPRKSFSGPILMTFVTLGPVAWFFIDVLSENYNRLLVVFVASLIGTILSSIFWVLAILPSSPTYWQENDEEVEDSNKD